MYYLVHEISKITLQFLKGSDIRKASAVSLPDTLEINNLPETAWKIPPPSCPLNIDNIT